MAAPAGSLAAQALGSGGAQVRAGRAAPVCNAALAALLACSLGCCPAAAQPARRSQQTALCVCAMHARRRRVCARRRPRPRRCTSTARAAARCVASMCLKQLCDVGGGRTCRRCPSCPSGPSLAPCCRTCWLQGQHHQGAACSTIEAVPGLRNESEHICSVNATVQWLKREPAFRAQLAGAQDKPGLLQPAVVLQQQLCAMDAAQRNWRVGDDRCATAMRSATRQLRRCACKPWVLHARGLARLSLAARCYIP